MLSSYATATSSLPSSRYETPSVWWKFNFTTNSCAALATAFLPSPISSAQESSTSNVVEKRMNNIDHYHQCE